MSRKSNILLIEDKGLIFIDPNTMIEKALTILNPTILNNSIKIKKNYESTHLLNGFENEYIQAIVNIINNAIDAIKLQELILDERYINITSQNLDDLIKITISDNGGGIDQHIINKIFEPYFTTKHKSIGVGLGLTMAHKIITQRNHGKIKIENSVLQYNDTEFLGAKVTITLPKGKGDKIYTTF